MARAFDDIKNVTKKKEVWRLSVRLEDIWSVYKGKQEDHLELLIKDIKGDAIQVIINDNDMDAWKPKLVEGKTYDMRNFKVSDNDFQYKMTEHKCKLTFVGATKVDELDIPDMPISAFKFKDFSEIKAGTFRPDLLVDVIGAVQEIRNCVIATSTRKGKVSFTMKDLSDEILDCTLWDNLAGQFLEFYNKRTDYGPVVMIMKHARVKEPQGEYPLQLTNVWNGTKLLFDENIPEIKAFRSRLPAEVNNAPQQSAVSQSSQYLTQSSAGSQYNTVDTFMKGARVVSLADMKKLKEDAFCVTVVTTSHVKVSNQGWCYLVCGQCSKKTDGKEPPYICKEGHKTEAPAVRYKLDVEVNDGDDDAKFVFWDSTLDDLLGITAAGLLKKMNEIGITDRTEYPDTLEEMMGRTFAFKVKWQSHWNQASVLHIKDSPDFVAKIKEQLPNYEISTQDLGQSSTAAKPADVAADSQPSQTYDSEDLEKFESLNDSILSTPIMSASSENEVLVSSQVTLDTALPVLDENTVASGQRTPSKRIKKRVAKHQSPEHPIAAQLSSTKVMKHIKKEK